MTCRCGAPCQGQLCKQCEIEEANEHLADELASDDQSEEETTTENNHARSLMSQLRQAESDGDLPKEIADRYDDLGGDGE